MAEKCYKYAFVRQRLIWENNSEVVQMCDSSVQDEDLLLFDQLSSLGTFNPASRASLMPMAIA